MDHAECELIASQAGGERINIPHVLCWGEAHSRDWRVGRAGRAEALGLFHGLHSFVLSSMIASRTNPHRAYLSPYADCSLAFRRPTIRDLFHQEPSSRPGPASEPPACPQVGLARRQHFIDETLSFSRIEVWIAHAPKPLLDDEITTIGCAGIVIRRRHESRLISI